MVFQAFCLKFIRDWLFLCYLYVIFFLNIELIFLKFLNNFFVLCFFIRVQVKQPKIKRGIILKLVNQFRLNFAEGFSTA